MKKIFFKVLLLSILISFGAISCDNKSSRAKGSDDSASSPDRDEALLEESDSQTLSEDEVDTPDEDEYSCTESTEYIAPANQENSVAVIITSSDFENSFQRIADLHSVTGVKTDVVTIEKICGTSCNDSDPRLDTARAIKSFIKGLSGLKYVVLGGDIEIVPSRKVHDKYSNTLAGTYEEDFYTDYYYSDLSDWDGNGNGIYAEDTNDTGEDGDSPDYTAEVAVSRIPVSSSIEVENYYLKLVKYLTKYNIDHIKKSLLLANVATKLPVLSTDVNAGYYFESEGRTVDTIPEDFEIKRLYADTSLKPFPEAELITVQGQKKAFSDGYNIMIHNGHGLPSLLTAEQVDPEGVHNFYGTDAYNLINETYPIYLSCACQAGQFEAPFTWNYKDSEGNDKSYFFEDDSAGELLVNAPSGGAIAYLGNTTTGLGLAGGSQLIDELLKDAFIRKNPTLGDSLVAAHNNLKEEDDFKIPVLNFDQKVVDPDSYRWTQKTVVMLGDILIPVWNSSVTGSPIIDVIATPLCKGVRLSFTMTPFKNGTLTLKTSDNYYEITPDSDQFTIEIEDYAISLAIGYISDNSLYFYDELIIGN